MTDLAACGLHHRRVMHAPRIDPNLVRGDHPIAGGRLTLLGLGVGAALMYTLDPDRGSHRRALIRDKLAHLEHAARASLFRAERDIRYRSRGLAHRFRAWIRPGPPPSDDILLEHVRAELGRHVTHARSIEVQVHDGNVTVAGPIRKREVRGLLRALRRVHGVREIENRLEIHDSARNVPGLQGQARPKDPRIDFLQERWAPSTRLVALLMGAGMGVHGLQRRGVLGTAYAAAGTALLLRGLTNLPMKRLSGIRAGRRAIDLHRTLTVRAHRRGVPALDAIRELPEVHGARPGSPRP